MIVFNLYILISYILVCHSCYLTIIYTSSTIKVLVFVRSHKNGVFTSQGSAVVVAVFLFFNIILIILSLVTNFTYYFI